MAETLFFIMVSFFLGIYLFDILGRENDEDEEKRERYNCKCSGVVENDSADEQIEIDQDAMEVLIDKEFYQKLQDVRSVLPKFEVIEFLTKAEKVFNVVFRAYLEGDKKTLECLVSDKILATFLENMNNLMQQKQKMENIIFSVLSKKIYSVKISETYVLLAVKFISEQCNVIKDLDGNVVKGSVDHIKTYNEIWTFTKDLKSSSPVWTVTNIESFNE